MSDDMLFFSPGIYCFLECAVPHCSFLLKVLCVISLSTFLGICFRKIPWQNLLCHQTLIFLFF